MNCNWPGHNRFTDPHDAIHRVLSPMNRLGNHSVYEVCDEALGFALERDYVVMGPSGSMLPLKARSVLYRDLAGDGA